jgi:tetratricopeptide (TPR) repeat protein
MAKDIIGAESTETLEVGSFLEGFEIADAPEFAMWKDRQQARLLPLIKDAFVLLCDRYRRTGQSQHIEHLADRMLLLDDLSEDAIRAKMEARAMAGDRLTALRTYEDWARRLHAELRARPSTTLEQMASSLRRGGWERTVVNDIPDLPPDHARSRAFVGRSCEFKLLYETWEELRKGSATHTLMLGDSGVGKTTLVERFTTAAALEGAVVCRVQAFDVERSIPFSTLGSLVASLLDEPGSSTAPPEALAELARTVPIVRRRFPSLPLVADSSGETARLRLTEAFQDLVRSLAEEHPLIFVVDDLHLADDASIGVLHSVLRRCCSQSVLAILVATDGELPQSAQATALRHGMCNLPGRLINLKPLSESHTNELLTALLFQDHAQPGSAIKKAILRASGGVPMVLELLVQDWRSHGPGAIAIALDAMTTDFPVGVDPELAYGHILSHITARLEPVARSVLALASVLGRRLNDLAMYSVIDLSLGQTMAALGQLCELRVLREGDAGLEFGNELIRAHVYGGIPSPIRKALHAAVADRLLLQSETADDAISALEVAWHSMRASRVRDAVPYLLSGAVRAMRSGAPQSAELALATSLTSLHGQALVDATFLLVEALQEQGRWKESLDAIEGLDAGFAEQRRQELFALSALARSHLGLSIATDVTEPAAALKTIMETCPHAPTRLRAALAAAQMGTLLRDGTLAGELLALTDAIPVNDFDADQHDALGLVRARLLYQAGDLEGSFELARATLQRLDDRHIVNTMAVQLQAGLGVLRARQGRYDEAALQQDKALNVAEYLGNDAMAQEVAANLALFLGRLGRSEEQLKLAQNYSRSTGTEVCGFVEIQLTYTAALALGRLGRPADALTTLNDLESRLGPQLPGWILQPWLLWKADALMVSGFRDEAFVAARRAVLDYDFRLTASAFAGCFARWLAIIGRPDEAGRALAVLSQLSQDLDKYDRIDQLEILCANARLCPDDAPALAARIRKRLLDLPLCTWSQLKELQLVA